MVVHRKPHKATFTENSTVQPFFNHEPWAILVRSVV